MSRYPASLLAGMLLAWTGLTWAEVADRDKPIHLESERLYIDDVKQASEFEGTVQLTQGTLLIQAEKILVTQDKLGYQYCIATGRPASFRQKREGSEEFFEGYGERIKYNTRAEIIDLYGSARVRREADDVQGDHITYNTRTEVFRVVGSPGVAGSPTGGRVRAVIQPSEEDVAARPAARKDSLSIKPSTTLSNKP